MNAGTLFAGGEPFYVYIDANADTLYSYGEDIVTVAVAGTTAVTATGQTLRLFDAQERIMMSPGTPVSGFNATSGSIVLSTDLHLTAGALDGTGTDRVLSGGSVLEAVPAATKYFDHDTSGSYANGDDVILDVDASGYYNADDILSLQVAAASASDVIDNSYLSAVKIYERVGNSCVGTGTDTLLGTDASSPFLAQAITLTKAAYAASDSVASRTLCVYADIVNNSVHGKIWQLVIPINGATFATGTSPTSDFTVTSNPVQFTVLLPATMTSSNAIVGATATYTFTYTLTEDPIANSKGLFDVTFPASFNIATTGVTCKADGVLVAMTASISGQSFRGVNASGSTVTTGSVIVCTMSGVRNATTAGTSGMFTIGADASSATRMYYVDTDNTVTLHTSSSDTVSVPIANTITLSAPNGGESLVAGSLSSVAWASTGTGISYVNLYYSVDSGSTWTSIATNEQNDGMYSWAVPSIASSTVMIKVEGTDLVTVSDDDSSDAVLSIVSSSSSTSSSGSSDSVTTTVPVTTVSPTDTGAIDSVVVEEVVVEPEVTIVTTSTLTGGIFIKLVDSPTIYAVDHALVRHAFFDAQTFFTYQTNFDGVLTVDEDTFNLSTLGDPMPVNPGTILVKFDGSSSVYTVQRDADGAVELGPISDEATLVDAMGDYWIDNMITLETDAFAYYSVASENHTSTSLADWAASGYLTNSWHLMYPDPVNDPDGDGAATWLEVAWGTSPYDADTDNDGYSDWIEVETGHSPLLDGGR